MVMNVDAARRRRRGQRDLRQRGRRGDSGGRAAQKSASRMNAGADCAAIVGHEAGARLNPNHSSLPTFTRSLARLSCKAREYFHRVISVDARDRFGGKIKAIEPTNRAMHIHVREVAAKQQMIRPGERHDGGHGRAIHR